MFAPEFLLLTRGFLQVSPPLHTHWQDMGRDGVPPCHSEAGEHASDPHPASSHLHARGRSDDGVLLPFSPLGVGCVLLGLYCAALQAVLCEEEMKSSPKLLSAVVAGGSLLSLWVLHMVDSQNHCPAKCLSQAGRHLTQAHGAVVTSR